MSWTHEPLCVDPFWNCFRLLGTNPIWIEQQSLKMFSSRNWPFPNIYVLHCPLFFRHKHFSQELKTEYMTISVCNITFWRCRWWYLSDLTKWNILDKYLLKSWKSVMFSMPLHLHLDIHLGMLVVSAGGRLTDWDKAASVECVTFVTSRNIWAVSRTYGDTRWHIQTHGHTVDNRKWAGCHLQWPRSCWQTRQEFPMCYIPRLLRLHHHPALFHIHC